MNKKKIIPTVTVALSALNEEGNISNWLNSVLSQKETNFKIKSIIIHSDGSTDRTNRIIKSFNDRRILLHAHRYRKGKSFRLNQIYKELKTDYLIQSDADVVFAHRHVFRDVLKPFFKDVKVMLCCGHSIPIKGSTFTEKAFIFGFEKYNELMLNLRRGNNIFTVTGTLTAYRSELCKKIRIPDDMIGNDYFVYFECVSRGMKYCFVPEAIVNIRIPSTTSDFIKQKTRIESVPLRLKRYFKETLVNYELSVPYSYKFRSLLFKFFSNPVYTFYIHLISFYCKLIARYREPQMNGKWEMITTTKKSIKI